MKCFIKKLMYRYLYIYLPKKIYKSMYRRYYLQRLRNSVSPKCGNCLQTILENLKPLKYALGLMVMWLDPNSEHFCIYINP